MPTLLIGLMSGTSLDGVDAVLIEFSGNDFRVIAAHDLPFGQAIRHDILALQDAGNNELHRTALLANELSRIYAACVQDLLRQTGTHHSNIKAICCHGQTIRHAPEQGYSWQIGNHALLAELCGIDVIGDFRSRDIAASGQGAPLVPAFHHHAFSQAGTNRVIINIGGIANLTSLSSTSDIIGFDTGPGNMLMDAWCMRHRGQPFDADGQWAASGVVNPALLANLLEETFFMQAPPKSTGRDLFSMDWLERKLRAFPELCVTDVQSTLAELTALSIVSAARRFLPHIDEAYICGGGARNSDLMKRIRQHWPDTKVEATDKLGLPAQQVEAVAFAWLGWRFLTKMPGNLPSATGAKGPRILGALFPA